MRLRNIKLSGFKSFVDPTTLNMPGNLVGIVGPNGCGKSNIIDAVTWVMGESSAKQLRGESMTDVIFNGSTARQPVGQASVELCFDNTQGKAGGEYAKYNELSIKRVINREAISTYYLNGTRCRKRDITSIFLGTGLGPRSYSIIEQGMISRLIEAKPEDLRSFIEEAAGISKYRERRRETENRIRHTRENLDRLNDIQEELSKQLTHLERQAKAALKFKERKEQEKTLKGELLALKWKELKDKTEAEEKVTLEAQNRLEQGTAKLRSIETEIEQQREAMNESNEHYNKVQSLYYQRTSDISQLEQGIKHIREQIESTQTEISKVEQEIEKTQLQRITDEETIHSLQKEFSELQPKLDGSRSESDKAYEFLSASEQAMQLWQSEWDDFNEVALNAESALQKNKSREEYLTHSLEENTHRYQVLRSEFDALDSSELSSKIELIKPELEAQRRELDEQRALLERHRQELQAHRKDIKGIEFEYEQERKVLQQLHVRTDTLDALQKSAMGDDDQKRRNWLQSKCLNDNPRLAQELHVEAEWAYALETVLGEHLHAIFIDNSNMNTFLLDLDASFSICLWGDECDITPKKNAERPTLADKVSKPQSLINFLSTIYIAESEEEANTIAQTLLAHESVITRSGLWLGKTWSQLKAKNQKTEGILEREQELQKLRQSMEQQQTQLQEKEAELNAKKQQLHEQENSIDELMSQIQAFQQLLSAKEAELLKDESRLEDITLRGVRVQSELDELELLKKNYSEELIGLSSLLQKSDNEKQLMEAQKQELMSLRQQHQESLEQARKRWQATHEESHGIALKLEAITSQKASLVQTFKRTDQLLKNHETRLNELKQLLTDKQGPLVEMQQTLEHELKEKVESEKQVCAAREQLQSMENTLRGLDKSRVELETHILEMRDKVEKLRLQNQESVIRLQTTEEQLQALERKAEVILETLSDDANISDWQQQLESIERKIQRLGPINLAAIDEHKQLSERKDYLDSQEADLKEALETLESAIRKIDKETRTRFKDTFDKLNTNLKELFPQLVGGGSAYLELTGDDLLDTGVTLMARPPGKKNSSIHLLSGGEKAMTAVALVFSIFKLNPAPFCILDEVDAPLDDNNTARFSEMLKHMSLDVQFLFITHNKITMEIAHQLLGVTMNEPGVSRLVSVDVDAAVEIAASA